MSHFSVWDFGIEKLIVYTINSDVTYNRLGKERLRKTFIAQTG